MIGTHLGIARFGADDDQYVGHDAFSSNFPVARNW
jgi:hypothetical protein